MLKIENLHVEIDGTEILKGLNLEVQKGKVHAIMGPNGSGKSTLSYVIAGHPSYEVTKGKITFEGVDITELEPHERAAMGLFLAFQYPVEIPGVNTTNFLKTAINSIRKTKEQDEIQPLEFLKMQKKKMAELGMSADMLKRGVNVGFSGGEKKRNETFQMSMLEPKMAILDETDSGLDIDALKTVANGVNNMRSEDRGFLVITHYQRLLDYIKPDVVHILVDGAIKMTGGAELALELEEKGYADFIKTEAA